MSLIETRGHVGQAELDAFAAAGFSPAQVFEVVAGVGASSLTNLAGNVARPPLEEPFTAQRWNG